MALRADNLYRFLVYKNMLDIKILRLNECCFILQKIGIYLVTKVHLMLGKKRLLSKKVVKFLGLLRQNDLRFLLIS